MEAQKRPSIKRKRRSKEIVAVVDEDLQQQTITACPQNSENDQGGKLLNFLIFMKGVLQRRELSR